ncbi:MAG: diacylglycerol kinase family protein [Anaerotardibacter sp.]
MARQSLTDAFKNAGVGIGKTATERNFRIELGFLFLVVVLGLFYQISIIEWAIVFVCCGLVLGGECLNSSIEAIVDLASPDYHELAGKAKDCAAGAVLIFSFGSFAVGVILFLPRILQTIGLC